MFTLFLAGFAATLLMTGLAWMVQLVHYPSIRFTDPRRFPEFHHFHSTRITLIVGPLMLTELGTAIVLVSAPEFIPYTLSVPALLLIAAIFADTAFRVVPVHNRLGTTGYDASLIDELTRKNRLRTFMWTARCLVLGGFFYHP